MKILHIAAAPDWFALFTGEAEPLIVPLACWALVEDKDGANEVVGLDCAPDNGLIDRVDDDEEFICYLHKNDLGRAAELVKKRRE